MLLEYLESTAGGSIAHIDTIRIGIEGELVSIDDATRKNLELTKNLRDGSEQYTLLESLDYTRTSMGKRLLRSWILSPLTDRTAIAARVDRVERLYRDQRNLTKIREVLSGILDIERLAARIGMSRAHAKDLVALCRSLSSYLELADLTQCEGVRNNFV